MNHLGSARRLIWFALLTVGAASGCVVPECFTFAKYFNSPNPAEGAPPAGGPHAAGLPPVAGKCPPPPAFPGEVTQTSGKSGHFGDGLSPRLLSPDLYNPPPPPPGPPPYEQLSLVIQKLALTEDEVKVARSQSQLAQSQLQEREQALRAAEQEIAAAQKSLGRAQEQAERWRKELEALRQQLKKTETENKQALEAIIRMLEEMLGVDPKGKKPGENE